MFGVVAISSSRRDEAIAPFLCLFYQSEAKLEPPEIQEKFSELLSCLNMTLNKYILISLIIAKHNKFDNTEYNTYSLLQL